MFEKCFCGSLDWVEITLPPGDVPNARPLQRQKLQGLSYPHREECPTRVTRPKGAKTQILVNVLPLAQPSIAKSGQGYGEKEGRPFQNGRGVIGKPILGF